METAVNLLQKKSSMSENIKIQMLELEQQKLTVHKDILQELQNITSILSSLQNKISGQYLTS